MKKKFLLTIAMSAIVFATSQAQEFRYGLSGGYNLNSMIANESKSGFHAGLYGLSGGYNLNSMIANESKSGFHAGLKGEYAFRDAQKGLYTDFGLMISSYGWKSTPAYENGTGKELEWDTTPYYLNIPIHLGYKFKVNDNLSIFVNAGPYFNIGMFGSSNNMFKDGLSPRFDWGIGFRAGVEIARHTQIAIGYDWGMKNAYMNKPETKNRTFVVSLTYYF